MNEKMFFIHSIIKYDLLKTKKTIQIHFLPKA
jgi:hypothetical protein